MSESATVRFARPITAAAGVYAPGHIGELTQYLPFELVDDVLSRDQDGATPAARSAVPGRGVLRARAGAVPPPGLCPGLAEAHRRTDRPGAAESVGEGAAGSAPPPRPGAVQGAVRGRRRTAGTAAHPRGVLPRPAHRRLRRLQLAPGARHRAQPFLAGPDPLPDGLRRLPHPAPDDPGRDRHPRPDRRRPRLSGRPRRGHPGPAAAAVAAPGHAGPARPGLRRHRVPHRAQPDRREVPGAQQVHPPATRADPPARRVLPVRPGRAAGAHHRRRTDRHRRRRQPGPRPLPADHHPAGPPTTIRRPSWSGSTTNAGRSRSPTWRCGTPSSTGTCCAPRTGPVSSRRSGPC